jgi:hypothetical protein
MQAFINVKNRAVPLLVAMVLALFSILMASLSFQKVSAGQLVQRKITIGSSLVSATGVTYAFSFRPTTTTPILGIAVQFCQNSPLPDSSCTTTNGVTGTPADVATVLVSQTGATPGSVTFDVDDTDSNQADATLLTHATGFTAPVTGADMTFSFTANNPTGTIATPGAVGTFYARLAIYSSVVNAQTFDPATGAMGTELDQGGVALSTARQLTVSARVQEELEFCIGVTDGAVDTDAEAPANCSDAAFAGTTPTVDIGVVSSTSASLSPVATIAGGNNNNGAAMIRTNAFNGAVITYFAVQDTSSGRLKVPGATCNTTGGASALDAGSGNQDQCFNSNADQDDANNVLATAGEKFGMAISHVLRPTGSTTTNLTRDGEYDGPTTPTSVAWNSAGTTTTIASSSTVLDYEMLLLRFAARTAATTPTGAYTSLSNYVATSTF